MSIVTNALLSVKPQIRALAACEYSGRTRQALRDLGVDAWSCDLLPSDDNSPYHIQGDVLKELDNNYDLMISHPPCQYLTVAGNAWIDRPGRRQSRQEAHDFFMKLYNAPIKYICVENPVGYMNTSFRKPDQIIHPNLFGDPELKRTCLWLKNLPKLIPTDIVIPNPPIIGKNGRKYNWCDQQSPSADRWKIRSTTFPGIAKAFAQQWTSFINSQ